MWYRLVLGLAALTVAVSVSTASMDHEGSKLEVEKIVNEIKESTSATEFSALDRAIETFGTPYLPYIKARLMGAPEAFAAGLLMVYQNHRPKGVLQRSRFRKLFEEYIVGPCRKVKELNARLDSVLTNYDESKSTYTPDRFNRMSRMCAEMNADTFKLTYRAF